MAENERTASKVRNLVELYRYMSPSCGCTAQRSPHFERPSDCEAQKLVADGEEQCDSEVVVVEYMYAGHDEQVQRGSVDVKPDRL